MANSFYTTADRSINVALFTLHGVEDGVFSFYGDETYGAYHWAEEFSGEVEAVGWMTCKIFYTSKRKCKRVFTIGDKSLHMTLVSEICLNTKAIGEK